MTILPKNKQSKSSGSNISVNNNGSSSSGSSSSGSSSTSSAESIPGSGGVIGPVVVGLPVSLSGTKRSREVASSGESVGGSGSSDAGPSCNKRRHHHRGENTPGSLSADPGRGSDRSCHRHHLSNPYHHLAKKVSGKSLGSTSSSADIDSMVGRGSPSTIPVVVSSGNSGSCNDSNNISNTSPIVAAPSPLIDLNGTNSSSDLSSSLGVLSVNSVEGSNGGSNLQISPPGSPTGYNSGDEYAKSENLAARTNSWTPEEQLEMERRFEKKLRKKGLVIVKMGEDGACLFRAVADQVYGDQEMHELVRKLCCDYMMKNSDYFSQYVTEDFSAYVSRKRRDHIQGNHVELQALSEIFARPIEVYHYSTEPINIFQSGQEDEIMMDANEEPIRLSYHSSGLVDSGHYNSVRSARVSFKPKATLIHYTPPQVLETAIRSSESDALEKAMLEDKLRASDWEATNEALEEQVARESYLEWVRETEIRKRKGSGNCPPTGSSVAPREGALSSSTITKSPSHEGGNSPKAGGSGSYSNWNESVHRPNRSPGHKSSSYTSVDHDVAAIAAGSSFLQRSGAETEREILARVLLESRREYLECLKAKKQKEQSMNQSLRSSKSPNYHSQRTTRSSSRSSSPSTSSSCYGNKESTPPPSSSRS